MECPEWMNSDFFEDIFKKDLQGKCYKIESCSCSKVVGAGDNYASTLYRAQVRVKVADCDEILEESFIVKSMAGTLQMFRDYGMFEIEVETYKTVIPVFEAMWKDIGSPVEFGPK